MKGRGAAQKILAVDTAKQKKFKMRMKGSVHENKSEITDIGHFSKRSY